MRAARKKPAAAPPKRGLQRARGAALAERLAAARTAAALSVRDLAVWFDGVSEAAVRTWLNGALPQAYTLDRVEKALTYLEKEVKRQGGHIVPLNVRQADRRSHVIALRGRYPNV